VLRNVRKYSSSVGAKVLYVLLASSFIIWGVGAATMGGANVGTIAQVYDERVSDRDLERETQVLRQRFDQILQGASLPPNIDLRGQAFDQLVQDALVRHEADQLGLDVTDGEVVAAITSMPELQQNGQFSKDLLAQELQFRRDRGEFEEQVRRQIMTNRLRALVTDGVVVTDAEVEERFKLDNEQVELTFVKVEADDFEKDVTLDDDALTKYVAEHEDRYRTPERVKARYVAYRPADFTADAALSDEAVQAFYDRDGADRFSEPEQVAAHHILVKTSPTATPEEKAAAKKKADDLVTKLRGGADFAALAKESSDDPGSAEKGGDLGLFPRGRMVPAFDEAAFSQEVGKIGDPVETTFGYHVIRVDEHRQAGTKKLEDVRDEIVTELTKERAMEMARNQADADRRAVVGGKPLDDAVGSRTIDMTPPFARTEPVPGVGYVPAFANAAFMLDVGQVSDLIETDEALYLLEPGERIPPGVPPLDEMRDKVTSDAKKARAQELAKERAEKLRAEALEAGLEAAAGAASLPLDTTGAFARKQGSVPKIGDTTLIADAFTLTSESPLAPRVYAAAGDAYVVALKSRTPADMGGLAAAKDEIENQLLRQRQQAAAVSYMNYLKQRAQEEGALKVSPDAFPAPRAG
jgi:peptidyl-prolyl cis-trans isomerase D